MRVLQHTSVRLTIQERLLGIWLLSFSTVCIGVYMFFLFEPPVDWIGAFCIALGVVFVALAPAETLVFDKQVGCLSIYQQRLLRKQITYHEISDIEMVDVESLDALGTRFYRISIQLASGQRLVLTRTVSTDWQQQQRIVRHIRGFLSTAPLIGDADLLQPTRPHKG
jgi:hypothetical protein